MFLCTGFMFALHGLQTTVPQISTGDAQVHLQPSPFFLFLLFEKIMHSYIFVWADLGYLEMCATYEIMYGPLVLQQTRELVGNRRNENREEGTS